MSFTLTHKQTAMIRGFSYRSRKRTEDAELAAQADEFCIGEDVGFRLWCDINAGRSVLVINCREHWTALGGGFYRIMDVFQDKVAQEVRPTRIFVATRMHDKVHALFELTYKRDKDIYTLESFDTISLRNFKELIGDESVTASYA